MQNLTCPECIRIPFINSHALNLEIMKNNRTLCNANPDEAARLAQAFDRRYRDDLRQYFLAQMESHLYATRA
jgi:hypothetical protein